MADAATLNEHCNTNARYLLVQEPVQFEAASATLAGSAAALIDSLALIATDCPQSRLRIVGHSDNRGPEASNQSLSRARAQSVGDALIARGIEAGRIEVYGAGSSQPIADNTTRSGRALNRRITLRFFLPD